MKVTQFPPLKLLFSHFPLPEILSFLLVLGKPQEKKSKNQKKKGDFVKSRTGLLISKINEPIKIT